MNEWVYLGAGESEICGIAAKQLKHRLALRTLGHQAENNWHIGAVTWEERESKNKKKQKRNKKKTQTTKHTINNEERKWRKPKPISHLKKERKKRRKLERNTVRVEGKIRQRAVPYTYTYKFVLQHLQDVGAGYELYEFIANFILECDRDRRVLAKCGLDIKMEVLLAEKILQRNSGWVEMRAL